MDDAEIDEFAVPDSAAFACLARASAPTSAATKEDQEEATMRFKPGDVVLCIDTKPVIPYEACFMLKAGSEYVVNGVYGEGKCVSLVGFTYAPTGTAGGIVENGVVSCTFCNLSTPYGQVDSGHYHFLSWRFVKADRDTFMKLAQDEITEDFSRDLEEKAA